MAFCQKVKVFSSMNEHIYHTVLGMQVQDLFINLISLLSLKCMLAVLQLACIICHLCCVLEIRLFQLYRSIIVLPQVDNIFEKLSKKLS